MKVKTSITLAEATLRAVDELTAHGGSRSGLIEQAVVEFVERRRRQEREARDRAILDDRARQLNREVEDVLAYQADLAEL
jgi:metal-responsive CopG/Arc/MetJ family transcriptional regulator